jgi:hypothetical protein
MLARVSVILFDCFETHGWRIMPSKILHPLFNEYLWIQGPAIQDKRTKEWKDIVYISDKNTYEMIISKIFDSFFMARQKEIGNKNTINAQPEIDIDQLCKEVDNAVF